MIRNVIGAQLAVSHVLTTPVSSIPVHSRNIGDALGKDKFMEISFTLNGAG